MISDIYYRKKMKMPYLSLIFIFTCFLVSIPTYFFPELYKIFNGRSQPIYFWQHITFVFEHGSSTLPLFVHLLANALVIAFFGVITERILGIRRFFILSISSFLVYYFYFHVNNLSGNGASGVIWSYTAVSFFSIIHMYKLDKNKLKKDRLYYLAILLLVLTWIVITLIDFTMVKELSYGIKSHIQSVIIGFVFALIWRDHIKSRIDRIINGDTNDSADLSIVDKSIVSFSLIIPLTILVILLMFFNGALTSHISPTKVKKITPMKNITEINESDNEIEIIFTHPMKEINSIQKSIAGRKKCSIKSKWIDNKTYIIKFSRNLYSDEKVKIILDKIYDSKGRIFNEDIILEYE